MAVPISYSSPASGVGQQGGGFSPTPAMAQDASGRLAASQNLLQQQLYNDPLVKQLTNAIADLTIGQNKLNTNLGGLIRNGSALAVQAAFNPTAQLVANTQQMMATQGFRLGGNFAPGTLFGGGFVTDQLSRVMLNNITQQFYNQSTGLPLMQAAGLSKPQMADALGFLTSRGAFSGMRLGDIRQFKDLAAVTQELSRVQGSGNTAYIQELQQLVNNKTGGIAFRPNMETFKRVNSVIADFASMLKDARQIFGNLPMGELAQAAEKLIGASVAEFGSVAAMKSRISGIKNLSASFGLNAESVAASVTNLGSSVQAAMFSMGQGDPRMNTPYRQAMASTAYGRMASTIAYNSIAGSLISADSNQALAGAMAGNNMFMRAFDAEQVQKARAGGMVAIMDEKATRMNVALAASFLLDTGRVGGPAAERVQNLLGMLSKTGDQSQITRINTEIFKALSGAGINVNSVMSNRTTADMLSQMSIGGTQRYQDILGGNLDSRAYNTLNLMGRESKTGMFSKSNPNSKAAKDSFFALATTLSGGTQADLLAAMNPDGSINQGKLDKLYAENPDLQSVMPKEKLVSNVTALRQASGLGNNFKSEYQKNLTDFLGNARNAHLVPKEAAAAAERRGISKYLSSIRFGSDTAEDATTTFLRGMFSGQGSEGAGAGALVGTTQVIEALKNSKGPLANLSIDKNGLINASEKEIKQLETVLGADAEKLYKSLGLKPGDRKGLSAALRTQRGMSALQEHSGAMRTSEDVSRLLLASKSTTESTALKLLEEGGTSKIDLLNKLGIKDLTEEEKKNPEKLFERIKKSLVGKDGVSKEVRALISGAEKAGYGGTAFETLKSLYNSSPELKSALEAQEKRARDDAAKDDNPDSAAKKRQEADKLKGLRGKLENEGKEKYVGILEITSESLAQLKLFLKNESAAQV
jgi:hypothetical protein